jgi:hypothetical protein
MTTPQSELRDPQSALPPPQFGLRTLLWVITGCAAIFALSRWLEPLALAGVVMLVLSVIAHVAGNAIGTRLRELGGRRKPRTSDGDSSAAIAGRPGATDFAPVTRLSQRKSLGWPIIIGTAAGTLVGGIGGGQWTVLNSVGSPGVLNVAVGVLAFAVLNGIGAFVIFGFIQVGVGAIRQALAHASQPDKSS